MPYRMKLFLLLITVHLMALPVMDVMAGMGAMAGTLDQKECDALRQQRQQLASKGVGQTLEKGAQWAAENLDERQLGEVGDFLQLMEKIRFQCKGSKKDAQSKYGLQGNVPLPVRNSRRVKKARAATSSGLVVKKEMAGDTNLETKAVLSAITKNADDKSGKVRNQMRESIE